MSNKLIVEHSHTPSQDKEYHYYHKKEHIKKKPVELWKNSMKKEEIKKIKKRALLLKLKRWNQ